MDEYGQVLRSVYEVGSVVVYPLVANRNVQNVWYVFLSTDHWTDLDLKLVLYTCLLYFLYTFEHKWINMGDYSDWLNSSSISSLAKQECAEYMVCIRIY